MNLAFCVGNGLSKNKLDLNVLKDAGPLYGCNTQIESFDLDNTIIVDKDLLIDLISRGYNKKTNIYTRKKYKKIIEAENVYFLDDPIINPIERWDREIHWGSGTHAINLAAKRGADIVIMVGYDLYNEDLDPSCWIYQINKCFELHPNTQFVQIQNKNWNCPKEWIADNFLMDNFKNLLKMIKE
jgi:hypothetical protein